MIKEVWYDLEYEDSSSTRGSRTPIVLYTSVLGLSALALELKKLADLKVGGRHEINIDGVDKIFDLPFTHIELRGHPLETEKTEEKSDWKKTFALAGTAITLIGFLAMYGLVRLVMDVFI